MIFDSLGIGELGVVVALVVVLVKPKELGKVMREFGKLKRKVSQIQADVKSQLDTLTLESEANDKRDKVQHDKAGMRTWAKGLLKTLPSSERAAAALAVAEKLSEWPGYKNSKVVACFAGTVDELDTEPVLQRILADGKILLLPYVITPAATPAEPALADAAAGKADATEKKASEIGMAPVRDLERDLAEGAFGIREPKPERRGDGTPEPDLVLVPGLCFDQRGGRLGKGLGFYDRYLAGRSTVRAGLGFDVQITQKNLTLDAHDQLMDAVLSEKRILVFSAPRISG